MSAKQYKVIRSFRRTDPRTGDVDSFAVGDPYSGPVDKPYLLAPAGPDGNGPLIAEVQASTTTPSGPSNKEK